MRRALSEYIVTGIKTNIVSHQKLLAHPEFIAGRYHTGFLDQHRDELLGYSKPPPEDQAFLAAAIAVAAAKSEQRTSRSDKSEEPIGQGRLSPWVALHRAKVLR
jgi:acetyl-CoA carboxylase biotin carboxylase subunit